MIGGQSEIAAFDPVTGRQLWRARHTPPGRGIFRTVAAIAARAASLYFRFGGPAMTAFRGVQIATEFELVWIGVALVVFKLAGTCDGVESAAAFVAVQAVWDRRRVQDRIDPSRQLDRLSRFLWHRERLATLRDSGCISIPISIVVGMDWLA